MLVVYLERKNRESHLFIHSINQQIFIECLFCIKIGIGVQWETRVAVPLKLVCVQERNREREGEMEERSVGGREMREGERSCAHTRASQHGCVYE